MTCLDYIDIIEWVVTCFADKLSPGQSLNYRISINLFTKFIFFTVWFFVTEQNSTSDQYIFTLVLWTIFDIQVFFELNYIFDNKQCSLCSITFRRPLVYKIIDILQTIYVLFYTFFLQEEDSKELLYIKITILTLCSIDLIMNISEFINDKWFANDVRQNQSYIDHNQGGGYKLFSFSVILGSVFAFYTYTYNLLYYYEMQEKASQDKKYEEEFESIGYFFRDQSLILAMFSQSIFDILFFILVCAKENEPFISKDRSRNCVLFMYGFLFGMMNLYLQSIIGLWILMLLTVSLFCPCLCECGLHFENHAQVQQEETQQN